MAFEFRTADRILFGSGAIDQVGSFAADTGKRVLLVTGSSADRVRPLIEQLERCHLVCSSFAVSGEPTLQTLRQGLDCVRNHAADLVIGFGGGSVIDAGKAIAALADNHAEVRDYLEVIGRGRPLENAPLPYVAVPTTAGTGAEVTRNAVLKSTRDQVKVSLRSPLMLPSLAVVDPQLTLSLPPEVTASTGMDALSQLLEAFVSSRANALTDAFCREGLRRAARSLLTAYQHPDNLDARTDMCLASLLSGLALANAGLGAVHGIAGPLGGMCEAPHGTACARLLPPVMEANVLALKKRNPDSSNLPRFQEAARLLTRSAAADAQDGVRWLEHLCTELKIPSLSECGLNHKQVPQLVDQARKASSMKGNPVELTTRELEQIIKSAI